jgi:predicted enzyme related to lactoylglutathione lyase
MTDQPASADGTVPPNIARAGKLSYVQIPAADVQASAAFYRAVFGWAVLGGGDDHLSFADASGDLIGAWVTGRPPSVEPGILPYIYVDDVDASSASIVSHGGEIVRPVYREGELLVATFRDPAGNVLGIWQDGAARP